MHNSIITTSTATVGGLTKAFILGFTQPTITWPQLIEVSIYAAISATIGYSIKMGFDYLKAKLRQRKIEIKKLEKFIEDHE